MVLMVQAGLWWWAVSSPGALWPVILMSDWDLAWHTHTGTLALTARQTRVNNNVIIKPFLGLLTSGGTKNFSWKIEKKAMTSDYYYIENK